MKSPGEISAMLYDVPGEHRKKRTLINKSDIKRKVSRAMPELRRLAQKASEEMKETAKWLEKTSRKAEKKDATS